MGMAMERAGEVGPTRVKKGQLGPICPTLVWESPFLKRRIAVGLAFRTGRHLNRLRSAAALTFVFGCPDIPLAEQLREATSGAFGTSEESFGSCHRSLRRAWTLVCAQGR